MNELYPFAFLALIVVVCIALAKRARRRKIGPAGVGALYGMLNEDQRQAVEVIVENKAESRDSEHADDTPHADWKPTVARPIPYLDMTRRTTHVVSRRRFRGSRWIWDQTNS